MKAQDIVIRPIITEKSMTGVANKKYTFEVCRMQTRLKSLRRLKSCSASRFRRSTP